MKVISKIIALVLVITLLAVSFAGCSGLGGKDANTAKDIKINYWNSGFGSEWIEDVVKSFKKEYPEYNVNLNASASNSGLLTAFGMEDVDDVDLYFTSFPQSKTEFVEPLNDILDSKIDGEKVTIAEKMEEGFKNNARFSDGNYYLMPYVGSGSFTMVYNKKIFKDNNISIPRTTNELSVVADKLYSKKIPAFISFKGSGYWQFALYVWYAQYEGYDYYTNNFFACKDQNGTSPSKDVLLKKDGRYEILKALEGIFTYKYILAGSNSNSHTIMQTEFVNGNGAMMYNGGWLENEAKSSGSMKNFGIFRLPVISSVTKKLSTVKSEGDLRTLITAVDSVIDGEKKELDYKSGENFTVDGKEIAAADWKHIYDARTTTYGSYVANAAFIPKYSTAKEGAKKFIKFLYSDDTMNFLAKEHQLTISGATPTTGDYDTSSWSSLAKEFYKMDSTINYKVGESGLGTHPIFTLGGASMYAGIDFLPHFAAQDSTDRWTADKVWTDVVKKVEDNYIVNWMANIS